MTESGNDIDVVAVLALFAEAGVTDVWRATNTDSTEEIFFVGGASTDELDVARLTIRLMQLIPARKVWITRWRDDAPAAPLAREGMR